MDIFKEIKNRVKILDICNLLNINLNRNYKCLCPFHKETTPSFSVSPSKNIFYCFGCNKKGDVITLVSELLNISPLEAAKYINIHLGLGIDTKPNKTTNSYANRYIQDKQKIEKFELWENKTFQILCNYYHLIQQWKQIKDPDNELYVEALKNEEKINYFIDEIFIDGTNKDKLWFCKNCKKVVGYIEQRVR